jgi:hypothetical protein
MKENLIKIEKLFYFICLKIDEIIKIY